MVDETSWTPAEYETWLSDTLVSALVEPARAVLEDEATTRGTIQQVRRQVRGFSAK